MSENKKRAEPTIVFTDTRINSPETPVTVQNVKGGRYTVRSGDDPSIIRS